MSALLQRETFTTSRLLEFCNRKELIAQTGADPKDWPLCVLKELVDNAADASEEVETAPAIAVDVSTGRGEIVIADNGPGIPSATVDHILDFSTRTSSREAYVSPTRGAQGKALKTIVAMPFALDGSSGTTIIEAQGIAHAIVFSVDRVRQAPRIAHETSSSAVQNGTRITVCWPDSASSILEEAKLRFLQIAEDYGWLNPHLQIAVTWDGKLCVDSKPSDPNWQKWRACDPTSAHWYDLARFERYIAAHVARDQDLGRQRTIREFMAELRGFRGSAKQGLVLDETGLARSQLSTLFDPDGLPRRDDIASLLAACRKHSQPVKPKLLGLIGREHLLACFQAYGVEAQTFKYEKALGETDSLPWVVETAFGYCPLETDGRRIIAGVNFSVGLSNPFQSFGQYGGEGLSSLLTQLRVGPSEPVCYVIHLTHPRVDYTDRGKTALIVPGAAP